MQATHTHDAIAEAAQLMKEAVDDIMVTLNEAASEGGMVGGMVESIAESIGRVSDSWSIANMKKSRGANNPKKVKQFNDHYTETNMNWT